MHASDPSIQDVGNMPQLFIVKNNKMANLIFNKNDIAVHFTSKVYKLLQP